ncbi:Polyadenylate-binding protein 3 [Camellia lanceoleosa]|uniref:Polyadenylate-binding protein 3 n=1 Tax=Camellia lanceoleosa TaxID=1840588 RepID=A0ACC0HLI5_9ERIC|nr:Polyadenylate-binding protein 3 [Camellia lanceoleosa]
MEKSFENGELASEEGWTRVSRLQRRPSRFFTVFIANIPESMSVDSLKGIFQRYSKVLNASILDKRTKRYNSRFGFIRYDKLDSAEEATRKFNGAWYGENRLIVKPAQFDKPFPFSRMPPTPTQDPNLLTPPTINRDMESAIQPWLM